MIDRGKRYRNSPNQYSSDQVPTAVVHSPARSDTGGMAGPVGAAVEVLVTRPDPPAALANREGPCPVDLAGAPLRTATGVRHVPPAAVPAAVDAEGDGVPLDHAMTVERRANTPIEVPASEIARAMISAWHDLDRQKAPAVLPRATAI